MSYRARQRQKAASWQAQTKSQGKSVKKEAPVQPIQKDGITAVLIVKNEEAVLARCLESLQGVDQIVVLDTGSKDQTCEIARRYTEDVTATPAIVPFHFAVARNRADVYVKHDWILTIDADEVLLPGAISAIRQAIQSGYGAYAGYRVDFVFADMEGENKTSLRKMKVYKRGSWRWEYRVHELLLPLEKDLKVGWIPEARMEHRPLQEKDLRRSQNLDLLKISVEESPDYIRNIRQLGMEYFITGAWPNAVEWLSRYLANPATLDDPLDRSETLVHIARAQAELGLFKSAYENFDLAIQTAPDRREPYFFKALALIKRADLDAAIPVLEACLTVPAIKKPDFHLNIDAIWTGELPQEALDFCHAQIEEAKAKLRSQTT